MIRVLIIDDEPQIRRALQTSLQARGYEVVSAEDGRGALRLAADSEPDIAVLDLGLPDLDGMEVLKRIRAFSKLPVIILTVRETQESKVAALDAGADDYVTKPFAMEELLARMRAALRRTSPEERKAVLNFEDLEVDLTRSLVRRRGKLLRLTPTEYRLLEALVTNPGKLLTHRWLLSRVWGPGYDTESQYLRVYIAQLRKKLEDDPTNPRWILTDAGIGYRWAPE